MTEKQATFVVLSLSIASVKNHNDIRAYFK